ncbi:MAG TPA: metallophosphoesterase [Anaeromyxobacteraceae bacterium]|nr:metallophosphoesterase [Anaeromyxobacteraceae bacterium]
MPARSLRLASRAAALVLTSCGPLHHAAVRPELLDPRTGKASGPLPVPGGDRLRVAVYGDAQGNRPVHRAVVEAIAREHPDLVIFAGDAVDCLPVGHLPDLGGWQYLVPLWPQYVRGYPAVSLASVIPFPAAIHETLLGPVAPPRDSAGLNGFLEDSAPLRRSVPYLFVPGNHDQYHRADRENFARYLSPERGKSREADSLWYSVDLGRWRFVVLDTGSDLFGDHDPMPSGGAQVAWLDRELADASEKGLRPVVVLHIPPFSSGREEGGAPWVDREVVQGVLDRHPVALVLSGHVHAYERLERPGHEGRPVTYLVTGGGGGRFFHSRAVRDPRSRVFVEEVRHFVLLDLGPEGIDGRMIPVELPAGGDEAASGRRRPSGDEFRIELR